MRAEIISIGDELLIGQTINTNAAWIGSEISKLGFLITRMVSIPDKRDDILKALGEASGKVDVVLITGGLGPTSDDITKPVLCDFFETHLVSDEVVLKMIEKMLLKRNFPLNENNRSEAEWLETCRFVNMPREQHPECGLRRMGPFLYPCPVFRWR
jgi:nicotinamide-nucleotide amidase